jgi:hypothetical protein
VLKRVLIDGMQRWLRRLFIKKFLSSDAARLDGARYTPLGLIDWDKDLAEYFTWLASVSRGQRASEKEVHAHANGPVGNGRPIVEGMS